MSSKPKQASKVGLSIIVTAHAEGILLHKTLASVRHSLELLNSLHISSEIIVHADNPSNATNEYLQAHKEQSHDVRLFFNHFGDLGASRNFSVQQARGKYVTFIDADDLMSSEWLSRAYTFLESHTLGAYIAHSEFTIEFGGADGLIIKHGEIDKDTDTLLSVFSNRWNSIIMAPRQVLIDEPYAPNSPGFGYEDWHLNCRLINRGIHNVLIPQTAIFVRRKDTESEWLRQKLSYSVLHANPALSFANIRSMQMPESLLLESASPSSAIRKRKTRARVARALRHFPAINRVAHKLYAIAYRASAEQKRTMIPDWLVAEWRDMYGIEKRLFLSEHLLHSIPVYDSLTPEHYKTGSAYKQLVDFTTKERYDYIIFVPWLIHGGADLVSINYANTIKSLCPNKNVLVIATLPVESVWASRLKNVDFMPFGQITSELSRELKFRLLEQLIENSGAECLHIINSELAYDFIETHRTYLEATQKRLVATSFSQSTDGTGRIFGYSHTHVPRVYEQLTAVTTDNSAVTEMWVNEYGFDQAKLFVHHQPVTIPDMNPPSRPIVNGQLRVLWAARLSPEKQPAIVAEIGRLLQDKPISIDMYGTIDTGFDTSFLGALPANVRYKGPFSGFFTLPLEDYDVYLYTSLYDGMPNAVLEAAGARLPIISSAVGGTPDFITDKHDGILVRDLRNPKPYADAILELMTTSKLLNLYSKRLYNRLLLQHSERAHTKELAEFLRGINLPPESNN